MNKYGLKRLDILPLLLMNPVFEYSNSGANKITGEKCFKNPTGFMHFGTRPGEDMKIASDNIVEGMEIDLNNFIRLRKNPSRQYHREETNSSKPE
jgi:hypothetical protein